MSRFTILHKHIQLMAFNMLHVNVDTTLNAMHAMFRIISQINMHVRKHATANMNWENGSAYFNNTSMKSIEITLSNMQHIICSRILIELKFYEENFHIIDNSVDHIVVRYGKWFGKNFWSG